MKKMKKMKKQFLSLFVLLCMIISMFPTTALAANIDVSGKVTVDRVYEEPTCADNLYYGEVNVNGSATESKTRLTHTVLPLIQWQYGNNTYQIIPSEEYLRSSEPHTPVHPMHKRSGLPAEAVSCVS